MDIFVIIIVMVAGVALLVIGANLFVDGASGLAKKLKISDFVIGMTVIAFGTSAPELAVSINAAISGSGDVLMGNVVGSNIINILLILGVAALITKLPVKKNTLAIEIPFLAVITVLFLILGTVGGQEYSYWEGGVLVALFACYIAYMVIFAIKERKRSASLPAGAVSGYSSAAAPPPAGSDASKPKRKGILGVYDKLRGNVWFLLLITAAGLAGVIYGADFVVVNVESLAAMIDNDSARKILSVTIVALGTSLPELVTSVVAAIKKNADIALGNIIGSNIFNILFVAGLPMLIFGTVYTSSYFVDMLVSIGATAVLAGCIGLGKGKSITRTGGVIMLLCLAGYLVYLFMT